MISSGKLTFDERLVVHRVVLLSSLEMRDAKVCFPAPQFPMLLDSERCPPRQKSRVERRKAKLDPLLTSVTVESLTQQVLHLGYNATADEGFRALSRGVSCSPLTVRGVSWEPSIPDGLPTAPVPKSTIGLVPWEHAKSQQFCHAPPPQQVLHLGYNAIADEGFRLPSTLNPKPQTLNPKP